MKQLLLILLGTYVLSANAQIKKDTLYYYNKAQSGVMIPEDASWYNAKSKFTTFDLDGKMLLIHFWDPTQPDGLLSLEQFQSIVKDRPQLGMLSVLRSDLQAFQDPGIVENLIKELKVDHPLILTTDFKSFDPFDFRGYPQVGVVLDEGQLLTKQYGLLPTVSMLPILDSVIKLGDELGLNTKPFRYTKEYEVPEPDRLLSYPSGICADERSKRLFVSDTGNDRVLVLSENGRLLGIIGTSATGFRNGTFGNSQFNHPMGLAFDTERNQLYIADALNHSIRVVDINTGVVSTCLGNGEQSLIFQTQIHPGNPMNLPTDLYLEGNNLYFTMAGDNQIWKMDIRTRVANLVAGKPGGGYEDGKAKQARLDGPQFLTVHDGEIFFTESSSSRLRKVSKDGVVSTILGGDSIRSEANLNIPNGLVMTNEKLIICDAHGQRILQFHEGQLTKLSGKYMSPGMRVGKGKKAKWNMPSDICALNGQLYVLDKNNHAIRVMESKKGRSSFLEISNYMDVLMQGNAFTSGAVFMPEPVGIPYGQTRKVTLYIELEEGLKWDPKGRNEIEMNDPGLNKLLTVNPMTGKVELECTNFPENPNASIQMYLTVKDQASGAVLMRTVQVFIPFDPDDDDSEPEVNYRPFMNY